MFKRYEELLIILFLSIFGGFSRLVFRVLKTSRRSKPPSFAFAFAQITISVFVGVFTWLLSEHYNIPLSLEAPIVMITSYSSNELLEIIHNHLLLRIEKGLIRFDKDSDRDN